MKCKICPKQKPIIMVLTGFGNREKVWNSDWALQGLEKCLNFILGLKKTCEPKRVKWVIGVKTDQGHGVWKV